jgi:hypothetical protein
MDLKINKIKQTQQRKEKIMKNYTSQKNTIKKYYNNKIKELKKAESFWNDKGVRITNPTEKQRANAIKKIEKELEKELEKLERIAAAEPLKYIKISVEWKKSATWGYNPTAESWTSGGYYGIGKASGCGYCKESASIGESLGGSLSLQKFIIENLSKFKDAYGVETKYGLAHLSISGKGVNTLLSLFRDLKGWKIEEMHGKSFDGYEIRKTAKK